MHAKMGNVNNLHNWNMAERSDLVFKSRIHLNQVSNDKVINGYFFNFEDDLYIKIIFVNTSSIDFLMRMPSVREAPFNKMPPLFGQIAITPPPRTQTGTLGHFFSGAILTFYHFYHFFTIFSE